MQNEEEEILEIVDRDGKAIGQATRAAVHANPALLHRVVHVLIFDNAGRLLLQRRSMNKDVAPGRWDTSVGGHINPGEKPLAAAAREMREELGISGPAPEFLYEYLFTNRRESELVSTFRCTHEGAMNFNRDEIDEVSFWQICDIQSALGNGILSAHFEQEFRNYLKRAG